MFHTKQLNIRINSLHEIALRLAYQNINLGKSAAINYRYLQYLLTEIYKVKMGLSTPITNVVLVFDQNDSCSLRSGVTVTKMNIKTGKFDFETISAIETVLWENVTKRYQKLR